MAETSIEWCDYTFNPWIGCQKVSPACANCYAARDVNRYGGDFLGERRVTSESNWRLPIKWNKAAELGPRCIKCDHDGCYDLDNSRWDCPSCGAILERHRPRVFCASWSDVFEDYAGELLDHNRAAHYTRDNDPCIVATSKQMAGCVTDGYHPTTMDDVRARLFSLIDDTPNLDWLLLTKRPQNIIRMWPDERQKHPLAYKPYKQNVWLGTTVENQEYADTRIPELLKCRALSPVLFLSIEPMLSAIDLGFTILATIQGLRTATSVAGWHWIGS